MEENEKLKQFLRSRIISNITAISDKLNKYQYKTAIIIVNSCDDLEELREMAEIVDNSDDMISYVGEKINPIISELNLSLEAIRSRKGLSYPIQPPDDTPPPPPSNVSTDELLMFTNSDGTSDMDDLVCRILESREAQSEAENDALDALEEAAEFEEFFDSESDDAIENEQDEELLSIIGSNTSANPIQLDKPSQDESDNADDDMDGLFSDSEDDEDADDTSDEYENDSDIFVESDEVDDTLGADEDDLLDEDDFFIDEPEDTEDADADTSDSDDDFDGFGDFGGYSDDEDGADDDLISTVKSDPFAPPPLTENEDDSDEGLFSDSDIDDYDDEYSSNSYPDSLLEEEDEDAEFDSMIADDYDEDEEDSEVFVSSSEHGQSTPQHIAPSAVISTNLKISSAPEYNYQDNKAIEDDSDEYFNDCGSLFADDDEEDDFDSYSSNDTSGLMASPDDDFSDLLGEDPDLIEGDLLEDGEDSQFSDDIDYSSLSDSDSDTTSKPSRAPVKQLKIPKKKPPIVADKLYINGKPNGNKTQKIFNTFYSLSNATRSFGGILARKAKTVVMED